MKCPVCKETDLKSQPLEEGLVSSVCGKCGGQWIESAPYLKWVEGRPPAAPQKAVDPGTQLPVSDSAPGKFCPGCGRFLARGRAGYGTEFILDRCGGCGGIWLDKNEWENLRAAGLHDQIHFIFTDRWQAEVTRLERLRNHEQILAEKLGVEALAEIKRIKAWLDSHPRKTELYAYLSGPDPSRRQGPKENLRRSTAG